MNPLLSFYQARISRFQKQLNATKKQLLLSSIARLGVFLIAAFLVYYFFGDLKPILVVILATIIIFLFLVSKHTDLQYKKDKIQTLISLNKTEIEVLNRNFSDLPDGQEFVDPLHFFSQDIDLFGKKSFFQYLNRTSLMEGKQCLANIMTENQIDGIQNKQNAIRELAEHVDFRQEFHAVADQVKTEGRSASVLAYLSGYVPFVPSFFKWAPTVFSLLSLIFITGFFLDFLSVAQLALWFIIGLGITAYYLKKINNLSSKVDWAQSTFQQYYKLLALLEDSGFSSKFLKERLEKIAVDGQKASLVLKTFSKTIDALDQRNNLIFGMLGNGFLLWDLRQSHRLEKWIAEHAKNVSRWFDTIEFMDAYHSLGNFAHNHPHYVFPEINNGKTIIKAENAVHPLIDPNKSVTNDYCIEADEFFIITGANMAGKSTFLRTISLQIVMSNVGLPICAFTCVYSPIKLITSMRTTDSLSDEASYFYSELTRLKFIVDQIKSDRYFIVLDEILKGTNSMDKAAGSRKFLEKLVKSESTGIIATHDLSLCSVAESLIQVKNHYFDAEIIDDELYFDYKFKDGVCQNMNASFLLKKMGIVDD